jgi:hypothetical protein
MLSGRRRITPRLGVALLLLVGSGLLAPTFYLGWYAVSATNGSESVSETFYMSGVHELGSGWGSPSGSYASSFADAYLPNTGGLYSLAGAILLGALLVGLAGGLLILLGGKRVSSNAVLLFALLATVLFAAAPMLLLAEQPSAVCTDAQHFNTPLGPPPSPQPKCTWEFYMAGGGWSNPVGGAGPGSTFSGQVAQSGWVQSWGPGMGWFVATFAAVLAFGAIPISLRYVRTADEQIASGRIRSSGSLQAVAPPPSRSP